VLKMKSRQREFTLLVLSTLAVGTSFVPTLQATTTISPFKASSSSSSSFSPSAMLAKKSDKNKRNEEFKWLNWCYRQWRNCPIGQISKSALRQMEPAIAHWGKRMSPDSAKRAEELLERLIEEYLAGNPDSRLSVSIFNSAMDAYAKHGNPAGVQRILRRMEGLRSKYKELAYLSADVFSMSTLATAFAKSRSKDAATKAEAILQYMDSQNLAPNCITYNSVLHALALCPSHDNAIRAESLIQQMKMSHAAGQKDCQPDIYSYQSLIAAWSRSAIYGSTKKAEQLLQFLDEEAAKGNSALAPNTHCFTGKCRTQTSLLRMAL
jgi:hypothetical protein